MKDIIICALKALGIQSYLVTEVKKNCKEMFFIRQTLDMTRTEKLDEWNVTVYHDDDTRSRRGAASCMIHQGMDENDVKKLREIGADAVLIGEALMRA